MYNVTAKVILGSKHKEEYLFLHAYFLGIIKEPVDFVVHRSHDNDGQDFDSKKVRSITTSFPDYELRLTVAKIDNYIEKKEPAISLRVGMSTLCSAFEVVCNGNTDHQIIKDVLAALDKLEINKDAIIIYKNLEEPNKYIIAITLDKQASTEQVMTYQNVIISYLLYETKYMASYQPLTVYNGLLPLPFGKEWSGPLNKGNLSEEVSLVNCSKLSPLSLLQLKVAAKLAAGKTTSPTQRIIVSTELLETYKDSRSKRLVLFAIYIIMQIDRTEYIKQDYTRIGRLAGLTHDCVKGAVDSLKSEGLINVDSNKIISFTKYDAFRILHELAKIPGYEKSENTYQYIYYFLSEDEQELAKTLYYRTIINCSYETERNHRFKLTRREKEYISNMCPKKEEKK